MEININELYSRLKKQEKSYESKIKRLKQRLTKVEKIVKNNMKDFCFETAFNDNAGCCICADQKECGNYLILKAIRGKNGKI